MDKKKKHQMQFWDAAAFAIIIPFALYFGAYGVVVERGTEGVELSPGYAKVVVVARYRWPWSGEIWRSEFGKRIFGPANAIDRKLYPEKWTLKE